MRRLGVEAAIVGDQVVAGDVGVDGDAVVALGLSPSGSGIAVPGFIDLQVNGFAGVDFADAEVDAVRRAATAMAAAGTTAFQATLITLPADDHLAAMKRLQEAHVESLDARLLGVHAEGPFLSPHYVGAHDPALVRLPEDGYYDRLLAAGPLTYVTIAPELPGAIELIRHLVRMGVVVAVGHSDADAATAHQAFNAGARAVTHLFNAQRPMHHRDPGLSLAALSRRDVVLGIIADGVHLAPETVRVVLAAAADRVALVTDAVSAAGLASGEYQLGNRRVILSEGEVRLADGTIAGSVLTMDAAIRNLVELGAPLVESVASATAIPAGLVGRPELGTLAPGTPADVTVLDDALRVRCTLVAGSEVYRA